MAVEKIGVHFSLVFRSIPIFYSLPGILYLEI